MTELSIPLVFHMIEIKQDESKETEKQDHNTIYSALYKDGADGGEYCANTTCWD